MIWIFFGIAQLLIFNRNNGHVDEFVVIAYAIFAVAGEIRNLRNDLKNYIERKKEEPK